MKIAITVTIVATVLFYSTAAGTHGRIWSCQEIRDGVRAFGVTALLAYARRNGYTEKEIAKYRKCLKKGK